MPPPSALGCFPPLEAGTCESNVTCSGAAAGTVLYGTLPWHTAHFPYQMLHCTSGPSTFPTSPLQLFSKGPFWVLGARGRVLISWMSPPRDKSSYRVCVRAVASLCAIKPHVSPLCQGIWRQRKSLIFLLVAGMLLQPKGISLLC